MGKINDFWISLPGPHRDCHVPGYKWDKLITEADRNLLVYMYVAIHTKIHYILFILECSETLVNNCRKSPGFWNFPIQFSNEIHNYLVRACTTTISRDMVIRNANKIYRISLPLTNLACRLRTLILGIILHFKKRVKSFGIPQHVWFRLLIFVAVTHSTVSRNSFLCG